MGDTDPAADALAEAAVTVDQAEPAVEETPPPETEEDVDESTFDGSEDAWDENTRSYIKQLREENKTRRLELRDTTQQVDAILGLDAGSRTALNDLARAFAQGNDEAVVSWMVTNARNLAGDRWAELAGIETVDPEPEPEPDVEELSLEERVAKLVEERLAQERKTAEELDRERKIAEQAAQIPVIVKELGYETGTEEHRMLVVYASQLTTGTIAERLHAADKALKAMAGKFSPSDATSGSVGPPPEGAEPSGTKPTGTPKERAAARVARMFAEQG